MSLYTHAVFTVYAYAFRFIYIENLLNVTLRDLGWLQICSFFFCVLVYVCVLVCVCVCMCVCVCVCVCMCSIAWNANKILPSKRFILIGRTSLLLGNLTDFKYKWWEQRLEWKSFVSSQNSWLTKSFYFTFTYRNSTKKLLLQPEAGI